LERFSHRAAIFNTLLEADATSGHSSRIAAKNFLQAMRVTKNWNSLTAAQTVRNSDQLGSRASCDVSEANHHRFAALDIQVAKGSFERNKIFFCLRDKKQITKRL
jgi:hypothetical protein